MLIIGLGIAILGCSQKEEEYNYYPIEVGNKWHYEFVFSTSFKIGPVDSILADTADGYVEIIGTDRLWSGEEIYIDSMKITPRGDTSFFIPETTFVSYIKVTEDTIFTYHRKGDKKPSNVEPRNLEVGNKWDSGLPAWLAPARLSNDTAASAGIVSKENIKVKIDSFIDCLKVKYTTNTGKIIYEWRADGMGIVKMETRFEIPPYPFPVIIKGELVSYEIKEE